MKAKFNFNTHQLAAGSRIANAHGRTCYTVVKALTLHGKHLTAIMKTIAYGCR